MATLIVPLPNETAPNVTQSVTLSGRTYVMSFRWNVRTDRWTFGMATEDGDEVLSGTILQCGGVGLLRTLPRSRSYVPPGELYCAGIDDPGLDTIRNISFVYVVDE